MAADDIAGCMTEGEIATALRRAFNLGQTYWQQADSEFVRNHDKSRITLRQFEVLVSETVARAAGK